MSTKGKWFVIVYHVGGEAIALLTDPGGSPSLFSSRDEAIQFCEGYSFITRRGYEVFQLGGEDT